MPRPDDADGAVEQLTDPEVMRFLGTTVPLDAIPDVIHKWLARWNENGFGPFAIERREDGRFVGRVGLLVWDTRTWQLSTLRDAAEHGQVELGWALARSAWGHGYAHEAALAARTWIRQQGFERLISLINPENVRSVRLAQRLGATPAETVTLFDDTPAVVWEHPS
jgi:RimJ/RimL family protein N-acetyltransferase